MKGPYLDQSEWTSHWLHSNAPHLLTTLGPLTMSYTSIILGALTMSDYFGHADHQSISTTLGTLIICVTYHNADGFCQSNRVRERGYRLKLLRSLNEPSIFYL